MQANVSDLLIEAANLLLVGMSVVFVFLTLLIVAVQLIAFLNAKFPEAAPAEAPPRRLPATKPGQSGSVENKTIAAISAAIHQYRKSR